MRVPLTPLRLYEHQRILELAKFKDPLLDVRILDHVKFKQGELPIMGFTLGSRDPKAPVLGLFGGVHGLERVGSHVALASLEHLISQLRWNDDFRESLKHCRIISIPLVNPGGMALSLRSNPNGIDLMRNAPIEALEPVAYLVGGHRISPKLPWYRGPQGAPMETEARALVEFVRKEALASPFSLCMDFHSGFGVRDRIWSPFARTRKPFPLQTEIDRLTHLLDETLPHHVYHVEPQSKTYLTHGDLWDYLFEISVNEHPGNHFIPLTLEMGSWMWVRKNPLQLFKVWGLFNPSKVHRHNRIMRRHLSLISFLFFAAKNYGRWYAADLPIYSAEPKQKRIAPPE